MPTVLITGSSGLIGSAMVEGFAEEGWTVHGIDNNYRAVLFGPEGDTTPILRRLQNTIPKFHHHDLDVRNVDAVESCVRAAKPDAIIHCAGQPSHDLASRLPREDFEINTVGTTSLLEAARQYCPHSPFVFLSTNKVYGDGVNDIPLTERETRYDFADPLFRGIDETFRIDQTAQSLMGASKAAADLLVQEYGRAYGIPTVCFRCSCITGNAHAGVELHGFLAYLARVAKSGKPYRIFGYKGKQVRDVLHAVDVFRAAYVFVRAPRIAAVYNLGGGRDNSISVLEALRTCEERMGREVPVNTLEAPRRGDHQCYISSTQKFRAEYPAWSVKRSLQSIWDELLPHLTTPASRLSTVSSVGTISV